VYGGLLTLMFNLYLFEYEKEIFCILRITLCSVWSWKVGFSKVARYLACSCILFLLLRCCWRIQSRARANHVPAQVISPLAPRLDGASLVRQTKQRFRLLSYSLETYISNPNLEKGKIS
jgi:hypothetical protein